MDSPLRDDMSLSEIRRAIPELNALLRWLVDQVHRRPRLEVQRDGLLTKQSSADLDLLGVNTSALLGLMPAASTGTKLAYTSTPDSGSFPNFAATTVTTITVSGTNGLTALSTGALGIEAAAALVPGALVTGTQFLPNGGGKYFTGSVPILLGGAGTYTPGMGFGDETSTYVFGEVVGNMGTVANAVPLGSRGGVQSYNGVLFQSFNGNLATGTKGFADIWCGNIQITSIINIESVLTGSGGWTISPDVGVGTATLPANGLFFSAYSPAALGPFPLSLMLYANPGAASNGTILQIGLDGTTAFGTDAGSHIIIRGRIGVSGTDSVGSTFTGGVCTHVGTGSVGGSGTVTSIGMTVPTGLAVSPASITTAGTFALTWSGVIPVAQIPVATSTTLGAVKPDGTIVTVIAGAITVAQASSSAFGVCKVDGTTITATGGVISAVGSTTSGLTTDAYAATVTFNFALTHKHLLILTGDAILAASGDTVGPTYTLILTQDASGGHGITWWAGIKWAGGIVPTLTVAPNKTDIFSFIKLGAGSYLGFIVGQNY